MKRYLLVLSVIILSFAFVTQGLAGEKCKNITIEIMQKHIPFSFPPDTKIISQREVGGLCEVIVNIQGRDLPIYVGKDFIILGQMFSNKKNVSNEEVKKLHSQKFLSLKKDIDKAVAITYTPSSTAKHAIYMFTDPLCPHCQKAGNQMEEIAKEYNVKVKVVFCPFRGRKNAIEAVCRNLDFSTYVKGDWKKEGKTEKSQCKKGQELIETSIKLAKKLGISGVPTFYLENGKIVVGANIPQLKEALAELTGKKEKKKF
ncbi:thiol:disulfide interchange protein, DsbC [Candidatus Desulfofervidus auxilii]|uniref:Thiol:disulfide interchange protein, DsbC n=1 Tax=Desulfofervidus auxilii TaxID=1621989 RepID=A0A7U4QJH2_DESA2|nr:thioredoxin fold domain-containing protein [Candidatus Desulfofervidus auxilii]AMM40500.1 thiol:disulfide interchange protein, DsbC [Candidatus Desulfofervidus auxilii]CAD7772594.1 Thioredoxin-like domain protein [Candidatus Methanoperedenaceae archaeon GB50]CAD7783832.1 MAG: Thioredoxin-like domain protein [Candidatus Methanoperedenaceae archaeon GB37]